MIDPVPRVLDAQEWEAIELGLAQRVRALNRFIADVYAEPPDRRRGGHARARDRHRGVLRARDAGRAPARRRLDRHRRPRPRPRRGRPLPGARGQRAHPERLLLRRSPRGARSPPSSTCRAADAPRRLDDLPRAAPLRARGRRARRPDRAQRRAAHRRRATTPPTTSTSGPPRRSASRCSSPTTSSRATTSASSTGAPTPTASTRRSAGCCGSRCARAASASSTRSAPGSPTTSSRTPTSKT